jgi:hypothetical protein
MNKESSKSLSEMDRDVFGLNTQSYVGKHRFEFFVWALFSKVAVAISKLQGLVACIGNRCDLFIEHSRNDTRRHFALTRLSWRVCVRVCRAATGTPEYPGLGLPTATRA